jgi:hypothetical protein
MKNNYYEYYPPFHKDLKSMFYKVTFVGRESFQAMKHIYTDPVSNNFRDMFIDNQKFQTINAMAKPAIAVYGYYINNPQQFGHNPENIVAWMFQYSARTLLSLKSLEMKHDKYYSLPNKFVTRHKEFILRALEQDAKIVARKAFDIESQRKT